MTYQPGQVAIATVRYVEDVRVFRYPPIGGDRWISEKRIEGAITHSDREVTNIRPLIVIDIGAANPGNREVAIANILRALRRAGTTVSCRALADQIEEQTRPAIEEPTGLAAAVLTAEGRTFIRTSATDFPWVDADNPRENAYQWDRHGGLDRCTPVEVLSPGWTP